MTFTTTVPESAENSQSVTIRPLTLNDLEGLIYLSKQTYKETFFEHFSNADEFEAYINEIFAPERLSAQLADPNTTFYFAIEQQQVTGYSKVNSSTSQTIFQGEDAAEIEHIYILQAYQHKHIGKALLNHTIITARKKGMKWLWLSVWENNHKAIGFYQRNGFERFDTHHYDIGGEQQTDLLMRVML